MRLPETYSMMHRLPKLLVMTAITTVLAGCATPRFVVPPARIAGTSAATAAAADEAPASDSAATPAATSAVTVLSPPPRASVPLSRQDWSTRFPADDSITVATQSMPLRDFVQYSFAELLKVSYVLAQGVSGLDEPVTLNVQKPISSRALYKLVAEMLDAKKVRIQFRDGVYYLYAADAQSKANASLGFGRRPQDVPDVPGKILQVVPLRYGVNVSIDRTILGLIDVQIQSDASQSALFVTGDREAILRTLDVVGLLDQPATRARQVALISLTYIGSKQLTEELVTLLENEGIPTGVGRADGKNVALVSLDQLGSIAVFASSEDLLNRVQYWVRQIDRPSQGPEQRYFIYHPRYARAADLGQSLAPLVGAAVPQLGNQSRDTRSAMGGGSSDPESQSPRSGGGTGSGGINQQNVLRRDQASSITGSGPMAVQGEGLTLSVDPRSNTLIFYTTGQRYQSLLPMIQRLDVAPKQILLEATIAEVTLSGEFSRGVEFAASRGEFSGGTEGNLGLPDGGLSLNWVGTITDRVRAKLVASNSLVNILSNPTLVVRDGVEAAIKVGNDVPTVGATATDPLQSDRVLTTVLYRKTGLSLRVRPTINAQGLVVMEIEQSISNAVKGGSDVAGAPLFFERAVSTEVVARSGQSVLLAGLVSRSNNESRSNVPGSAEVPLLGWFFESKTSSNERTELVVLITPRIINSPDDWDTIRPALQGAMEQLQLP